VPKRKRKPCAHSWKPNNDREQYLICTKCGHSDIYLRTLRETAVTEADIEEGEQTTLNFRDDKSIFIDGVEYTATLRDGMWTVDWIEEGDELEVIDILKKHPQSSPAKNSPLILQTLKVFKKVQMPPLTNFKKVAG